jgi:hypothetical protein
MRNLNVLKQAEPVLPQQLSDRQQDVCEPLLAIAELLGDPEAALFRASLLHVFAHSFSAQDDELLIRLLKDIWDIFTKLALNFIATQDLLHHLNNDETAPWNELVRGRPLTAIQLARMLKPLKIYPKTIRLKNPAQTRPQLPKGTRRTTSRMSGTSTSECSGTRVRGDTCTKKYRFRRKSTCRRAQHVADALWLTSSEFARCGVVAAPPWDTTRFRHLTWSWGCRLVRVVGWNVVFEPHR